MEGLRRHERDYLSCPAFILHKHSFFGCVQIAGLVGKTWHLEEFMEVIGTILQLFW